LKNLVSIARAMLLAFLFVQTHLAAAVPFYFIIRVDDIMSRNTAFLPRSITPFQDTVESRGAKVTWAVIPNRLVEPENKDGLLVKELKTTIQRGHEIALHGFIHVCSQCGETSHEMFCSKNQYHLPYEQQRKLIADGLKILSDSVDIKPSVFVPPGHQADTVTYQVLLDQIIPWISTTLPTKQRIFKTEYNLAPNNEYTWQMTAANYSSQLHAALADIRQKAGMEGYYCLLLHDYFIRSGYGGGVVLRWVGELLDSIKIEYADRLEFTTISEAALAFSVPTFVPQYLNQPDFILHQNYPNPFNGITNYEIRITNEVLIKIQVFDLLGRDVATVVNERMKQGTHRIEWNAGKLPSGVYFYRLEMGNTAATKKMVLLR
jgi:predicted deacetylase